MSNYNVTRFWIHTFELEKKRVSGRVRVEPTRLEPDPKTRYFRVSKKKFH